LRRGFALLQGFARPYIRHHHHHATNTMIPAIPEELLQNAVETMCYFFTAIGVLLTCLFSPR
jgi:hypothetical protein